VKPNESPAALLDALEKRDVAVRAFEVEDARDRRRFLLDLQTAVQPHTLTVELMRLDQVLGVRWRD
jgi:hypothetical protein